MRRVVFFLVLALSFLAFSSINSFAEQTGIVVPRKTLYIPLAIPARAYTANALETYPLVHTADNGYIILVSNRTFGLSLALLPFRDSLGNPTANEFTDRGESYVKIRGQVYCPLKRAVVPLLEKNKYGVISEGTTNCLVLFTFGPLSLTTSVSKAECDLVSQDELDREAAEQRLRRDEVARQQAEENQRIANYKAEQRAKGLIEHNGQWMTAAQVAEENRLAAQRAAEQRKYYDEQRAKGLIVYNGQWMTPEQAQRAEYEATYSPAFRKGFEDEVKYGAQDEADDAMYRRVYGDDAVVPSTYRNPYRPRSRESADYIQGRLAAIHERYSRMR